MTQTFNSFCFSENLATLASYLPSYDEFKSIVINNNFFQSIKTVLFEDWHQDEIYPASVEDLVRRIYDDKILSLVDIMMLQY